MPLGWERINVKQTAPNKNIVFIKPLPGSTEKISKDFLERIAAQCLPVMNKHHLAVVSLEEYEYNTEFLGRNFNNGEVIQLVLRSASGNWLPFTFVQMVMMHELAHNKQMNHSKAFWAVRNEFAAEMKVLWEKGYSGDGLWGRGVLLENGLFTHDLDKNESIPEHMCGGTFKSRGGKKRKVKPRITYKEQKERRIRKKFGSDGITLGADDETKIKLEKGKKPVGKPRVAGSARGRELRAAAALARFEVKKEEPQIKDEELVTDSEAETDLEDDVIIKAEPDDAIDIDGKRLLDRSGHGMVKVCEDEDKDGVDAKNELLDLHTVPRRSQQYSSSLAPDETKSTKDTTPQQSKSRTTESSTLRTIEEFKPITLSSQSLSSKISGGEAPHPPQKNHIGEDMGFALSSNSSNKGLEFGHREKARSLDSGASCPLCSVVNDLTALTCVVCANVLKPEFVPNHWRCNSPACGEYINAGDVGLCGVCGIRKEVSC